MEELSTIFRDHYDIHWSPVAVKSPQWNLNNVSCCKETQDEDVETDEKVQ
jgi:hypothetical protein